MAERRASLLVELGCEELPPKALPGLARAFFDAVCEGLETAGVQFEREASHYHYSPRRMAVQLAAVAERQPDRSQDRRGPSTAVAFDDSGAPTAAATGFARSVDKRVEDLDTLSTDQGEWLFCRIEIPGQPLAELIFPLLADALGKLPVPKPMRWSDHDFSFVRPVHWLVVLHGKRVLDGELYGCQAGRETRGHRIHAPGPHVLPHADAYLEVLREARVLADHRFRSARIRDAATAAGQRAGGEIRITDELLEEVSNLLEWPVAVLCRFDESFLEVPPEALVASMENHQKFFPVLEPESGRLTPAFVAMSNLDSQDPEAVRHGFERVIRPRLADAQFFWEQDLKSPLEDGLSALDDIVFEQDLGSIGDKSRRIVVLSKQIAALLGLESAAAERAAQLCKCDLNSLMVGEFPELQGIMGGYYAQASGEPAEVVDAIRAHYQPRFSGDEIPAGTTAQVVALADRLDTLVGIFAAGLKPTGNKDPYALRRAALGVIRILLEGRLPLEPLSLLDLAAEGLGAQIDVTPKALAEVRAFLLERLRQFLRTDRGASSRQVMAVLAAPLGTLMDLEARLAAVNAFMQRPEAGSLVASNKRIGNILKKSDDDRSGQIDASLVTLDQERVLFDAVQQLQESLEPHYANDEYDAVLTELTGLKTPIDDFFDHVMVMDEDPAVRANRILLLSQTKALFDQVADFSQAD